MLNVVSWHRQYYFMYNTYLILIRYTKSNRQVASSFFTTTNKMISIYDRKYKTNYINVPSSTRGQNAHFINIQYENSQVHLNHLPYLFLHKYLFHVMRYRVHRQIECVTNNKLFGLSTSARIKENNNQENQYSIHPLVFIIIPVNGKQTNLKRSYIYKTEYSSHLKKNISYNITVTQICLIHYCSKSCSL